MSSETKSSKTQSDSNQHSASQTKSSTGRATVADIPEEPCCAEHSEGQEHHTSKVASSVKHEENDDTAGSNSKVNPSALSVALQTLQTSLSKLQQQHNSSQQQQLPHQFQQTKTTNGGLRRVCSFCGLTDLPENNVGNDGIKSSSSSSTAGLRLNVKPTSTCSARSRPDSPPLLDTEQLSAVQSALEQLQANGISLFPSPSPIPGSPTAAASRRGSSSDVGSPSPSPSPATPNGNGQLPHNHSCFKSAILAGLRNFALGVGLKAAVALVPHLRALKWPKWSSLWNRSSMRFGLFLGGFAAMYKGLNCLISATLHESGRVPSFLSGAIAAASIFALESKDRTPIAVYLFVRAMVIVGHAASHQPWYPKSLANFKHTDVLLMCLSASQILFAYIFEQDTLPKSYLSFLLQAGSQDQRFISLVAKTGRNEVIDTKALDSYIEQRKVTPPFPSWNSVLDHNHRVIDQKEPACSVLHPNQTCVTYYMGFVFRHFFQYSLRFYVPLNLISAVLFRSKDIRENPRKAVYHIVRNCIRSAAFLATYCGNAWLMCCLLRQGNLLTGLSTWCFVGPFSGLAVGLESKSRRLELAIYCMSPALQSFYRCFRKWNFIPKIHYIDYLFFAIAMGVIMSAMQNDHHHMLYYYPSLSKIMKSMIGIDSTDTLVMQ